MQRKLLKRAVIRDNCDDESLHDYDCDDYDDCDDYYSYYYEVYLSSNTSGCVLRETKKQGQRDTDIIIGQ